jgi:hypothetical protein
MKFKDEESWNECVKNNTDPYGKCGVDFARSWAEIMEKKIEAGEKLVDIASSTSHEADVEGVTGFMYGCAVSILSQCWIHGEELRQWHNLDSQIQDEGEKANKSGGVINPALVNIDLEEL